MNLGFEFGELNAEDCIFSDETHFLLRDFVNKQYFRFWGTEPPHFVETKSLHLKKVTEWAAITPKGVFIEFFKSPVIKGEVYCQFLKKHFFPYWASKKKLIENSYFMQGGATPHRTVEVFQPLFSVYGNRVMALGYPKFANGCLDWPSDLNPCHFFRWGFIKDECYLKHPETIKELKDAIRDVVRSIDEATIQRIYTSFKRRIEFCSKSNGEHFEGIVFYEGRSISPSKKIEKQIILCRFFYSFQHNLLLTTYTFPSSPSFLSSFRK